MERAIIYQRNLTRAEAADMFHGTRNLVEWKSLLGGASGASFSLFYRKVGRISSPMIFAELVGLNFCEDMLQSF